MSRDSHWNTIKAANRVPHTLLAIATILTILAFGRTSSGQSALAFEVASIKPNRSDGPASSRFPLGSGDAFAPGGMFLATNQPLIAYVRFAFKGATIEGLPSWVSVERFDIEARAVGSPSKDQMRLMMQALLKGRFGLVFHTERRTTPGLALRMAKKGLLGPQLHRAEAKACGGSTQSSELIPCGSIGPSTPSALGRLRISARSIPLVRFAAFLTNPATGVDRPVFDETSLRGDFDLDLEWTADVESATDLTNIEARVLTFSQALRDQLGLTLTSAKGTVEVMRVDRLARPSAD